MRKSLGQTERGSKEILRMRRSNTVNRRTRRTRRVMAEKVGESMRTESSGGRGEE